MLQAAENPQIYCTTFGAEGSYYDHITDILKREPDALQLVNLDLSNDEIYSIIKKSGFDGVKLDCITKWISGGIVCMKDLSMQMRESMAQGITDML